MMKKITKLTLALVALLAMGTACSKYPGFKKDENGLYYKYYVENKDAAQPQLDDVVEVIYGFYTKDSVIMENAQLRDMIIESLYDGDIYTALRKLHVGDSATFIMNGDTFYHYFMGQPFPFEKKELFFDVKLLNIIPKEEFEKQQAEQMKQYEAMIEEFRLSEDSLINDYIKTHSIKVKPTISGLYLIKNVSGKGNSIVKGSKIKVHYTGKLLDGTVFDSSVERGAPIDLVAGQGSVILGWEEALLLMKKGDQATVLIPSKLAYGNRGNGPIPPYTPLLFDMEIMEVE
jgi:FKBP-type peptidyl-prolyl cis-trans isomerase